MSNQLSYMLSAWLHSEAGTEWVLGTVYKTEGSAYRKAGSMMLINSLGQQFGMLSGGCLESDIMRNARKVMATQSPVTLIYDSTDEDDLSFQLGIGCGGKVYIMLQPLHADNDLNLGTVATALSQRISGTYHQKIGCTEAFFQPGESCPTVHGHIKEGWLITPIIPEPHLLVVGGGIDAIPMVRIAKELGWRVTLADPRPANARADKFPYADTILRELGPSLTSYITDTRVDAAVLMSHNIDLDAQALLNIHLCSLKHIALLGPLHRYHQVLERAAISESLLGCPVSGPAGLKIGGQLPESIALSILSECHAVLHSQAAKPHLRSVAAR